MLHWNILHVLMMYARCCLLTVKKIISISQIFLGWGFFLQPPITWSCTAFNSTPGSKGRPEWTKQYRRNRKLCMKFIQSTWGVPNYLSVQWLIWCRFKMQTQTIWIIHPSAQEDLPGPVRWVRALKLGTKVRGTVNGRSLSPPEEMLNSPKRCWVWSLA